MKEFGGSREEKEQSFEGLAWQNRTEEICAIPHLFLPRDPIFSYSPSRELLKQSEEKDQFLRLNFQIIANLYLVIYNKIND